MSYVSWPLHVIFNPCDFPVWNLDLVWEVRFALCVLWSFVWFCILRCVCCMFPHWSLVSAHSLWIGDTIRHNRRQEETLQIRRDGRRETAWSLKGALQSRVFILQSLSRPIFYSLCGVKSMCFSAGVCQHFLGFWTASSVCCIGTGNQMFLNPLFFSSSDTRTCLHFIL